MFPVAMTSKMPTKPFQVFLFPVRSAQAVEMACWQPVIPALPFFAREILASPFDQESSVRSLDQIQAAQKRLSGTLAPTGAAGRDSRSAIPAGFFPWCRAERPRQHAHRDFEGREDQHGCSPQPPGSSVREDKDTPPARADLAHGKACFVAVNGPAGWSWVMRRPRRLMARSSRPQFRTIGRSTEIPSQPGA